MLLKFTYLDQWRHIPRDEQWEVSSDKEAEIALQEFRERHESYSPVMVFRSEDGKEWRIRKLVDGDERYRCQKCRKYLCEKQLLRFKEGVVCFECFELRLN